MIITLLSNFSSTFLHLRVVKNFHAVFKKKFLKLINVMTLCEFDFDLKIKYIIIFDGFLGPSFAIEKSNENPIFKCNKKTHLS
jgi:hypothetical protein